MHNSLPLSLPHDRSNFFDTDRYWDAVVRFFEYELLNDGEDISSHYFLERDRNAEIYVIAKESGIFAGKKELDFFIKYFFSKEGYAIEGVWEKKTGEKTGEKIGKKREEREIEDGEYIEKNQKIFRAKGNAYALMKFERIFLNVLSRMSGIATQTQKRVELIKNSSVHLAATRKTQWSYLDKKAVSIGGGLTHRMGLFDAIMLKENHQIIGDYHLEISEFLSDKNLNPQKISANFFEIEVETEEEFQKIFSLFWERKYDNHSLPLVIMLDNFSPEKIKKILSSLPEKQNKQARHRKKLFLEASGGISTDTLIEYSQTGVDVVSMGGLTNFVKPMDYSMRVKK